MEAGFFDGYEVEKPYLIDAIVDYDEFSNREFDFTNCRIDLTAAQECDATAAPSSEEPLAQKNPSLKEEEDITECYIDCSKEEAEYYLDKEGDLIPVKKITLPSPAVSDNSEITPKQETISPLTQPSTSVKDDYELERLYEWVMDDKRKPAITAFTSGWVRNIASAIELRLWQNKNATVKDIDIDFAMWITGHDRATCEQLRNDFYHKPNVAVKDDWISEVQKAMFWNKVNDSGRCWNWNGSKNSDGYGTI
jgi:disulfide oxidoreductase YuzD